MIVLNLELLPMTIADEYEGKAHINRPRLVGRGLVHDATALVARNKLIVVALITVLIQN